MGIITHRRSSRFGRAWTFPCFHIKALAQIPLPQEIRYAYKAPGTATIYMKDYVQVGIYFLERQGWQQQQLLQVIVLPGQSLNLCTKGSLINHDEPT
jgi:hypothetical protein